MGVMITFSHDEIQREIAYDLICETMEAPVGTLSTAVGSSTRRSRQRNAKRFPTSSAWRTSGISSKASRRLSR